MIKNIGPVQSNFTRKLIVKMHYMAASRIAGSRKWTPGGRMMF